MNFSDYIKNNVDEFEENFDENSISMEDYIKERTLRAFKAKQEINDEILEDEVKLYKKSVDLIDKYFDGYPSLTRQLVFQSLWERR